MLVVVFFCCCCFDATAVHSKRLCCFCCHCMCRCALFCNTLVQLYTHTQTGWQNIYKYWKNEREKESIEMNERLDKRMKQEEEDKKTIQNYSRKIYNSINGTGRTREWRVQIYFFFVLFCLYFHFRIWFLKTICQSIWVRLSSSSLSFSILSLISVHSICFL